MQRAADHAQFSADPVGRFVATERCAAWCSAEDLLGAAAWDEPSPEDVDFMAAAWDALLRSRRAPFDKVFDARFVTRIREDSFARLVAHARERVPVPHQVRKQVLLAPTGIASSVVHGFWNVVPSRHPWHVTHDDADGFTWLGRAGERAAIAAVLDGLRDGELSIRLRRWLEGHLLDAQLDDAAAALGVAARSLQRQLGAAGTSFRDEVRAARLDVARRMLAEPDAKIEAVAVAVGFESSSTFVRTFRQVLGETPAAFRDRVAPRAR